MADLFRIISKEEAEHRSIAAREMIAAAAATPLESGAVPPSELAAAHAQAAQNMRASPDVARATETPPDDYVTRLAKLIPAEAVSAYGAGTATAAGLGTDGPAWWAVACLFIAVVLRIIGTQSGSPAPTAIPRLLAGAQWETVISTAIAFVIWVYALGGHLPLLDFGANAAGAASSAPTMSGIVGTLAAIVYAILAPNFVRGSSTPPAPSS